MLLLFVSITVYSQNKRDTTFLRFNYRFFFGPNYCRMDGYLPDYSFKEYAKSNVFGGIGIGYQFSKSVGVRTEFIYNTKGDVFYKDHGSYVNVWHYMPKDYKDTVIVDNRYLDIPVLMNVKLFNGFITPSLYSGLSFNYLLEAKLKKNKLEDNPGNVTRIWYKEDLEGVNKYGMDFIFGGDIAIRIKGRTHILLGGRYSKGLTKVFEADQINGQDTKTKYIMYSLYLGMTF